MAAPETLLEILRARISGDGPLSLADYMADALMHPTLGYYATRDPFGVAGDFTTAPEISQMFGEMIGLWSAVVWQQLGTPAELALTELGPGRGTLMADALRAAATIPPFREAIRVHLVETSPHLRQVQERTLAGVEVRWHDRPDSLPDGPMILIANEFLDALPIHQLIRRDGAWHERLIGLEAEGGLAWRESDAPSPLAEQLSSAVTRNARDGDIAEISPTARAVTSQLAARIMAQGGAALLIDYGYSRSAVGDTFQALRGHEFAHPLEAPGSRDLTAHVDFEAVATAARAAEARALGPTPQGSFLRALGIETRATQIAAANSPRQARETIAALRRLIAPEEMGTLFKVMAITSPDGPVPPGFEDVATQGETGA